MFRTKHNTERNAIMKCGCALATHTWCDKVRNGYNYEMENVRVRRRRTRGAKNRRVDDCDDNDDDHDDETMRWSLIETICQNKCSDCGHMCGHTRKTPFPTSACVHACTFIYYILCTCVYHVHADEWTAAVHWFNHKHEHRKDMQTCNTNWEKRWPRRVG